ncbi:MAG: hypothetical protein MJZ72_10075, partial [Bacteroidales bacterium]|nr:hypothetical protein [Bacteroidales bacterium]
DNAAEHPMQVQLAIAKHMLDPHPCLGILPRVRISPSPQKLARVQKSVTSKTKLLIFAFNLRQKRDKKVLVKLALALSQNAISSCHCRWLPCGCCSLL